VLPGFSICGYFEWIFSHSRATTPPAGLAADGFEDGPGFVLFAGALAWGAPGGGPFDAGFASDAVLASPAEPGVAEPGFPAPAPAAGTSDPGLPPGFAPAPPGAPGDFPSSGTGGASTVRYCTMSEILRFDGSSGFDGTRNF
jgi:hypothetical protein